MTKKRAEREDKPALIAAVLKNMADGISLRKCCEGVGLSHSTFLLWIQNDQVLADHYARARDLMIDAQAEELEAIGEEAARAETAVQVNGLRLKSDNRKWLLSKLAPKKYGDKLAIGGADDMPAIKTDGSITIEPAEAYKRMLGG